VPEESLVWLELRACLRLAEYESARSIDSGFVALDLLGLRSLLVFS
jgi:hypothetical protein